MMRITTTTTAGAAGARDLLTRGDWRRVGGGHVCCELAVLVQLESRPAGRLGHSRAALGETLWLRA